MTAQLRQIKTFYEKAFQTLNNKSKTPEIEICFYPYIGVNHTIRIRDRKVYVRLADLCHDLPSEAQKSLAFILVAKLLRKKVPAQAREIYRASINNGKLRDRVTKTKRERGRKIITTAKGDVYDLRKIFAHLNQIYFDGAISEPILTWSVRKTYRILGHHDATHETIVVSRSLDAPRVPKYVVEFVVFHEMLHIFHPTVHRDGRRYNHTPAFRCDEKQFAYFEEAERWIESNVKNLKRSAKKVKK
ncbi:MAG: SprT-like domain-containing protein [Acidobacteriota bacterium]|nr:SprT-like domain-containing protein [Acidobacteriota bacterium]